MLRILGSPQRLCDQMTRREWLHAGALSALGGLSLPTLLCSEDRRAEDVNPPVLVSGKAKHVIVLYLLGGAATQDMFDLKPDAPAGIRSEFKPIPTTASGIQICEHLPGMARWMHKAAVVRSVNHRAGCHNPLPSYTGWPEQVTDLIKTKETYPPSVGSVVQYLANQTQVSAFPIPNYVYMPCYLGWGQAIQRPGPYGGFLGKRYDPFFTECNPHLDPGAPAETAGHPQVLRGRSYIPSSTFSDDITIDRLESRRNLLDQIDDQLRSIDKSVGQALLSGAANSDSISPTYDRYRQRAFSLLTSAQAKAAFDLDNEDPRRLDRYGRTLFGNSLIVAKRLIEAGVRFVNVTWDLFWERLRLQYDGWDTHQRNFAILKDYNLPYFDVAFSALMEDLAASGLLDETLIVVMSEMGRTPQVNSLAGRDHWTFCYSNVLAGAGIRGGTVYGASDPHAAYVKDLPVSPADICATIYQCLGIDPEMLIYDKANRPMAVAHGGRPIEGIIA